MRSIFCAAALVLTFCLSTAFAQPQLSLGINGGTQFIPNLKRPSLMLGVSSWFRASHSIWLSGELLRYEGCDRYPSSPSGFVLIPARGNSLTQRFVVGLHFPLIIKNTSTINLLGIGFGHSWDKCRYGLYELPLEPPSSRLNGSDNIQRSALYGSLTAMSRSNHFPFTLQVRFGLSFSGLSSLSFADPVTFGQVVAGIHLGFF